MKLWHLENCCFQSGVAQECGWDIEEWRRPGDEVKLALGSSIKRLLSFLRKAHTILWKLECWVQLRPKAISLSQGERSLGITLSHLDSVI